MLPFAAVDEEDLLRCGEPDLAALRRRAAHAGPVKDDTLLFEEHGRSRAHRRKRSPCPDRAVVMKRDHCHGDDRRRCHDFDLFDEAFALIAILIARPTHGERR